MIYFTTLLEGHII